MNFIVNFIMNFIVNVIQFFTLMMAHPIYIGGSFLIL